MKGYKPQNYEFKAHQLNKDGYVKLYRAKKAFDILLSTLRKNIPPSREMSLCVTKLEEACFFASRAVSINEKNHKDYVEQLSVDVEEIKSKTLRLKTKD